MYVINTNLFPTSSISRHYLHTFRVSEIQGFYYRALRKPGVSAELVQDRSGLQARTQRRDLKTPYFSQQGLFQKNTRLSMNRELIRHISTASLSFQPAEHSNKGKCSSMS